MVLQKTQWVMCHTLSSCHANTVSKCLRLCMATMDRALKSQQSPRLQMQPHSVNPTDATTLSQPNRCNHTQSTQQMQPHSVNPTDATTLSQPNRCNHTQSTQQMQPHSVNPTDATTLSQPNRCNHTQSNLPCSMSLGLYLDATILSPSTRFHSSTGSGLFPVPDLRYPGVM